jgi:hypothetical protein
MILVSIQFFPKVIIMKFGFRTPNLKRSISARTTGRLKRSIKKAVIPGYGKKGMGILHPKKALYNKVYHKTTFGLSDLFKIFK